MTRILASTILAVDMSVWQIWVQIQTVASFLLQQYLHRGWIPVIQFLEKYFLRFK